MKVIERQIFGGTNFLVVLWTLISLFRLVTIMHQNPITEALVQDLFVFILPLIFLLVLNLIMGIASFFPQKKNKMWILSVMIATVTLLALNTFQVKIEDMRDASASTEQLFDF